LNFGIVPVSETSAPMTVTLFNDPKDPKAGTVSFTGNVLQGAAFAETDNCEGSLAPGASCTFNITFTPLKSGGVFTSGTITIGFATGANPPQSQTIYLRGTGE
jgi:hypothetical protein